MIYLSTCEATAYFSVFPNYHMSFQFNILPLICLNTAEERTIFDLSLEWAYGWCLLLSHFSRVQVFAPSRTSRLLCPWDSSDINTGVGCHALLHGIFPTQGSKLCLLQLLDFIKIKNFCSAEDNVKKIRYATDRENYVQKTHLIKDCYSNIKRTLKTQQ